VVDSTVIDLMYEAYGFLTIGKQVQHHFFLTVTIFF